MQDLPQKQAKAVISLLNSRTISEAASQTGVNESTMWRWMREEAFQEALQEAKHRLLAQAVIQLQQATGEAVETLRTIITDKDAPASSRVSAAKVVLETAVKVGKIEEIETRLNALEANRIRS